MGEIETRRKKRAKKRNIKRAILSGVQLAALAGTAIAVPNAVQGLAKLGVIDTTWSSGAVNRARNRYLKQGLLSRDVRGYLRLTERGKRELLRMQLTEDLLKKKRWDGCWRVLIFDIPEKKRSMRAKIRQSLVNVGFLKLQNSVWIYPYDCEDFVALMKADLKIGKDLLYMVVDELEGDTWICDTFGVSR
jgi:DNA-binding transcriptional regulator PaaX